MCFARFNGKHGIQQQHALGCPALQEAMLRTLKAWNVLLQLFIHIQKRWRYRHARQNREGQPVRLSGAVVGILPEDDHFDIA